jgi:DNA (cytosine-5)-methyltransferase 1
VTTLDPNAYGPLDAIVGGFPCQDVSNAGHRAGLSGSRSGLYGEVVRCLRVARPRVGILENVAALLARGMGTVLGDLAAIGYDAEWDCIPASALGAPHRRDRVFIVAHAKRGKWTGARRWTPERVGGEQQPFPWNESWECALRRLRGVDDGLSYGVDRTNGIRNAVVPQVAEVVGRAVLDAIGVAGD